MPKRSEEHMQGRQQQILEAAHALFRKKGFHQTSVDDICKEAGLSVGALYTHFKNKRDIYLAITEKGDAYLIEDPQVETVGQFAELLAMMLSRAVASRADLEMELQLLAQAVSDDKVGDFVRGTIAKREQSFLRFLRSLEEKGQLAQDYDPVAGARRIDALLVGMLVKNYYNADQDRAVTSGVFDAELALMMR